MKSKIMVLLLTVALLLSGCGKAKTVSCDRCGEPQKVKASSNVDDSWIIYCTDCEKELFGEEGLVPKE